MKRRQQDGVTLVEWTLLLGLLLVTLAVWVNLNNSLESSTARATQTIDADSATYAGGVGYDGGDEDGGKGGGKGGGGGGGGGKGKGGG